MMCVLQSVTFSIRDSGSVFHEAAGEAAQESVSGQVLIQQVHLTLSPRVVCCKCLLGRDPARPKPVLLEPQSAPQLVLLGLHFTNSHCCQRGPEEDFFQPGLAHNELLGCSCCNFVRSSSPWWRQWLADSQFQSSGQRTRFASLSSGKMRGLLPCPTQPRASGQQEETTSLDEARTCRCHPPCLQPVLLCFLKVEHCGGGVEGTAHF